MLRFVCCFAIALGCWAATPVEVARHLAQRAKIARASDETVRAYLLYIEAVARDPENPNYRANRDALEPLAKLLLGAGVETVDIGADIKEAEQAATRGDIPFLPAAELKTAEALLSIPHVAASGAKHDFDLLADEITLFQQVVSAYGVHAVWDPQIENRPNIRLHISGADFRSAMDALTAVTGTFVFPISKNAVMFAFDSEEKRTQLEPTILLSIPLPNAVGEKDLVDVANAVRSVMSLRSFGWDSVSRTVFIRDRVTRALTARSLLEALLLPKGQVSLEVEILTLDDQTSYHYGAALQSAFSLVDFGHANHFQTFLSNLGSFTKFATFGGGATLIGLGIADASLFASYSKSVAHSRYDAVVMSDDGETANLHVGEKYPIPQSLYTGASQGPASIYNPIGQFTLEDLGIVLKMTPRVNGAGEIALDIEAEFKSLGSATFNTVPSVSQRKFTGSVVLREGEWAVLAGLDENSADATRNGLAGLGNVPGLNQILSENTRDLSSSDTLVVIKPTIVRLPMSSLISPQYLLGPARGVRVLL